MCNRIFERCKFISFIVLAATLQAGPVDAQEFQPKFDLVEISGIPNRDGAISLADTDLVTLGDYSYGVEQGKYRIEFSEQDFVCRNIDTGKEVWRLEKRRDENTNYHFLKTTADEALFSVYPSSRKARKFETPPAIHHMGLADGVWQDPLALPEIELEEKQAEFILEATTSEDRKIVFSTIVVDNPSIHENGKQLGFRVACFDKTNELDWVKRFETKGSRGQPGAFILGGGGPSRADGRPGHLNVHGNLLAICGGPLDDVTALELNTGKSLWSVPRIWEIRRGFTGPSVWSHHLGRYGFQSWDLESVDEELPADASETQKEYRDWERRRIAEAKERIESETSSIVAGPFIVPTGAQDYKKKPELRIFVATANCRDKSAWPSYLSDCVVYELDQNGTALSMTRMPRMVLDSGSYILDDGIVFRCQGGALSKLGLTKNDRLLGAGPGGPDKLGRLDWYREIRNETSDAWLSTPPATGEIHYHGSFAFFAKAGGFIKHDERQVYLFPVQMMNMENGVERQLIVSVPFEGRLHLPSTNFSRSGDSTQSMHALKLAVTRIFGDSKSLTLVLATEQEKKTLTLPFSVLIPNQP